MMPYDMWLSSIIYKDSRADVGVLVRGRVVAVRVEQAVVSVLAIVTADIQHHARSVVVASIAKT
jgi:hypothetical protein